MAREAGKGRPASAKRSPVNKDKSEADATDPIATSQDDPIAARAYRKWEAEGRPDGADERHWHEARRELDEERSDEPRRGKQGSSRQTP